MVSFLAENIVLFQLLYGTNPDLRLPNFTPIGNNSTSHMFEVIVVKEDALQIVDDHIDCPVGGVPDLFVISAPGRPDPDQHEGFFEV